MLQMGGFVFLFVMVYLFWWQPAMKQEKELQNQRLLLQGTLQKGDQILTSGGIYGTVVSVPEEKDEVILRIEDQVKIRVTRSGVVRNFTKEGSSATSAKPG